MSTTTNIADVQDAFLEDPLRLLNKKVQELTTVWKLVDHNGYEHPKSDKHRLTMLELDFAKSLNGHNSCD